MTRKTKSDTPDTPTAPASPETDARIVKLETALTRALELLRRRFGEFETIKFP